MYDLPIVILGTMVYNKDILRRKEINPMEWIQIIKDLAETVVLVYAAWELIRKLVKKIRKKTRRKNGNSQIAGRRMPPPSSPKRGVSIVYHTGGKK